MFVMNEKEIPQLIRAGDANKSFQYLYKAYFSKVQRMILNRSGSKDDAKDVFQDTIVALYRVVLENRYQDNLQIGAFIMGVAQKFWINKHKRDSRIQFKEEILDYDISVEESSSIQNKEKASIINAVMSSIGETCKEILIRVIYNKMSMKETAEDMHFSNEDSAKTQHYKCRKKLMDKFKDNVQLKEILSEQ